MTATEPQNAYILHRRPYRETSLLVELFAERDGRVGVVARGGRKPRKGGTVLEPFRPLRASWAGRSELRSLGNVEPAGRALVLGGEALYLGFYLNELLVRLCPRFDPYPRMFRIYESALAALAAGERDQPLRAFERCLLQDLGLAPDWGHCAGCGVAVSGDNAYAWEAEQGLLCETCSHGAAPFSGHSVRFISGVEEAPDPEARRQARDLMRKALAPHLGSRPLESRALLRSLRRGKTPS
ncbi:DNA repair protein RecO [Thiohalorhabdus methylotrophus]|uniref:DNA repair protein RecO n=1 Tax=Thiohalorhabdus methylotrophus TaxID=3242694 RepID=A0ABV4TXN7_9GAMM